MDKLINIYKHLQDSISQEIFCNRLLYSITANRVYLEKIVNIMMSHSSKTTELYQILCKIKAAGKKVIIYGAGAAGESFGIYLKRLGIPIAAYCDSNIEKQGHFIDLMNERKEIISIESINSSYFNDYVMLCINNPYYRRQVIKSLLQQGLKKEQIIEASDYFGKQYFDASIPFPKERLTKDKIFVDAGCYDLGTALEYKNWNDGGGNYFF